MTSFTVSDEWKNEEEWANRSREELLEIVKQLQYDIKRVTAHPIEEALDNEEEWADSSREELLSAIETFGMAWQVALMKSETKDKEIARLKKEIEGLERRLEWYD